jgi:hypothetical protein
MAHHVIMVFLVWIQGPAAKADAWIIIHRGHANKITNLIIRMSLLVAGLLFFILSPGVLLTIPPCSKGLFASGQTSIAAAAVHAVVFVAVSYLLMSIGEKFVNMPHGGAIVAPGAGHGSQCVGNGPCKGYGGRPGICQNGMCVKPQNPDGGNSPGGSQCVGNGSCRTYNGQPGFCQNGTCMG